MTTKQTKKIFSITQRNDGNIRGYTHQFDWTDRKAATLKSPQNGASVNQKEEGGETREERNSKSVEGKRNIPTTIPTTY